MKKNTKRSIVLVCLTVVGYWYYYDSQPNIWGDEADEPYITISGFKPPDATIDAWAIWGASGPQCGAKTWSADSGWSSGADVKWHVTYNFSNDPNRYELRIPFQQYQDSFDCEVNLGDITVQAYNAFDTVGFAQLRIYQSGTKYYNKPIDLDSTIEAKDCRTRYYEDLNEWSSGLACSFYTNGEIRDKQADLVVFNAYSVYFDFSQFNSDTVIHYDILAGKEYRSTPVRSRDWQVTRLTKRQFTERSVALVLVSVSALSGLYSILNTTEQESILVTGLKPTDATVKVWANYWVYGDDCESYSYDMFGQKAHRGGKITTFFTPSNDVSDDRYQFTVPYSTYTNSENCVVELRDIKVEAYNAFDTVGFAQLRIYQSGTDYNNKPLELTSQVEARDCRARYYEDLKEWSSGLACSFYTNGEIRDKKSDLVVFNAYSVYFDFSQFNSDTVIHYDILAGEEYRSAPLDPETGK